MKQTRLISVIIPVYQCSEFLDSCLDSIAKQYYKDFEVIMVDDGSMDGSGDICDSYVRKDVRFKVLHQKNSGVSIARNNAIDLAVGDWITFIDADDLVAPEYLLNLNQAQTCNNSEFVCGGMSVQEPDSQFRIERLEKKELNLQITSDARYALQVLRGCVASKLFSRSIIEKYHLRFDPKIKIAEDLCFTYDYVNQIQRISLISACDYIYRLNSASVTHNRKDSFDDNYRTFQHLNRSLKTFVKTNKIDVGFEDKRFSEISSILLYAVTLLYKDTSMGKSQRNSVLNSIHPEEWDAFRYHISHSLSEAVLAFLFLHKHIRLADTLLSRYYSCKTLKE